MPNSRAAFCWHCIALVISMSPAPREQGRRKLYCCCPHQPSLAFPLLNWLWSLGRHWTHCLFLFACWLKYSQHHYSCFKASRRKHTETQPQEWLHSRLQRKAIKDFPADFNLRPLTLFKDLKMIWSYEKHGECHNFKAFKGDCRVDSFKVGLQIGSELGLQ